MIEQAERAIGYTFKDKELLKRALTLSSASENNNENLEFFGDAILEFIVSERIFGEEGSEGELTERRKAIVEDEALKPVSIKLGLDKLLIKGKNDNNNLKAVPSVYEAVVAAIYLDGGMERAKEFVLSTLDFSITGAVDYKSELQKAVQALGKPSPKYSSEDIGTPQKHVFKASVEVFGKTFFGEAERKQTAEKIAAENALKYYESKNKQ